MGSSGRERSARSAARLTLGRPPSSAAISCATRGVLVRVGALHHHHGEVAAAERADVAPQRRGLAAVGQERGDVRLEVEAEGDREGGGDGGEDDQRRGERAAEPGAGRGFGQRVGQGVVRGGGGG